MRVIGVNVFVIHMYIVVIRFTHLKTREDFQYVTISENDRQFSVYNISADGDNNTQCKSTRAALFQSLLRISS